MGLCRCAKRKVTTQFCYEHRVNVCESCMIDEHPNCIVQGYLQWLKDSDYDPICTLCRKALVQDECIRLLCYHVFHWRCLDEHLQQLPLTTAPAGYTCPCCGHEVIPRDNFASPVAEVIRQKLQRTKWANGGTLPQGHSRNSIAMHTIESSWSTPSPTPNDQSQYLDIAPDRGDNMMSSRGASAKQQPLQDSFPGSSYHPRSSLTQRLIPNDEEDKYKRKSVFELLHRWFQSKLLLGSRRRDPTKRLAALTVAILLIILLVVYFMSRVGRSSADGDLSLNPENNPEIRNNI